jgi:hypothetical protein
MSVPKVQQLLENPVQHPEKLREKQARAQKQQHSRAFEFSQLII